MCLFVVPEATEIDVLALVVDLTHPESVSPVQDQSQELVPQTSLPGEPHTEKQNPKSRWFSGKRIHLPMQETQDMRVQSFSWEDPLEEEMATHSSVLACENPVDKAAWQATVHKVAKSRTRLSRHTHTHTHTHTHNTGATVSMERVSAFKSLCPLNSQALAYSFKDAFHLHKLSL